MSAPKFQNGKPLFKAGKPAFCCCAVAECCLYPGPDPEGSVGGPFYPADDLPDTLILTTGGGFGGEQATLTRSGYVYTGDTVPSALDVIVRPGPVDEEMGMDWEMLVASSRSIASCLVGNVLGVSVDAVEDEFPDTLYFHDSVVAATAELLRESLCCWEGTLTYINDSEEEVNLAIRICYVAADPGGEIFPDGWPGKPCWLLTYGESGPVYSKEDPQSSPEGDYSFDRDGSFLVDQTP